MIQFESTRGWKYTSWYFRGGPLIIQGGSENEKKIGPDIGSEKKNRAKIFEKIKNPTIDFPPWGIMVKSEKKKSGQASVQKFSFVEKILAKKKLGRCSTDHPSLDD